MGSRHLQRQWDPQTEQQPEAWAEKPGGTMGAKPPGWPKVSSLETSVCQRLQEEPEEQRFFSKSTKP